MTRTFTCPRCGQTSHHPMDVLYGYCGACHLTRIGPGVYSEGAEMHLVIPELLEAYGWVDTPENRDAVELAARRIWAGFDVEVVSGP